MEEEGAVNYSKQVLLSRNPTALARFIHGKYYLLFIVN